MHMQLRFERYAAEATTWRARGCYQLNNTVLEYLPYYRQSWGYKADLYSIHRLRVSNVVSCGRGGPCFHSINLQLPD